MWPFRKRPKDPFLDPTYGDPHRKALIRALEKRSWKFARELLNMAADPDEMAFLMEAVGGVDGIQDWIDAEPESTLPVLVAGCHAVHWAWEARGGKRAKYTTAAQFRGFHERLRHAETLLRRVLDREPDNVTAWAWLVTSSRGLGVGSAEALQRFEAVTRLHPGHVVAHEQRLQYLCAKWSGSHEEMFDFARGAATAAGPNSLLHELVAVAHIEKWSNSDRDEPTSTSSRTRCELNLSTRRRTPSSIRTTSPPALAGHPAFRHSPWPSNWPTSSMRPGTRSRSSTGWLPSGHGRFSATRSRSSPAHATM
ncbi:protein of unknown function [Micromonospora phaseoli]|uniref:DUF4034 domain-containing protein n=1 Tax=Micromonospora phaseoli TaxID=1144548 RepID=A0A1H7DNH6_9ACTN|nr:uncharacterized protein DUF4034 [Micromonospora phaseoli]SEK03361.1 protein of unknown function [Micromonospora phaseoli]